MAASHESLRDLYETSTPVMDAAVEDLNARRGVYGARMTGGGFGGCVVALVDEATAPAFLEGVASRYRERTRLEPTLYLCHPEAGVSLARTAAAE